MSSYDVLIVGGGPSGLSAGITTAKEGLSTLIIEEHMKIGEPLACGEGVSADKLLSLDNMPKPNIQLDDKVLRLQRHNSFVERVIGTQRFFFGTRGVATAHLNTLTINRPLFDQIMAKNAQNRGAELTLGTQVVGINRIGEKLEVKTTKGTFKTKIVIGCDGPSAHSVKMMNLDPPSKYVQGVEYKIENVHTDALDFYFDFEHFSHMHYGWVFPKKTNTNIGVVVDLASRPLKILDQFINNLKHINLEKSKIVHKIAGIIPASGPIPKYYTDNFMAAGDAAGMTNSVFYGGISIGIHSGMLAGETAVEAHEIDLFDESQMRKYQMKCNLSPYTDPIIQQAHNILYNEFTAEEIDIFGSWVDGWDITTLSSFKKLRLFIKALFKPSMLKKFNSARIIAHGFSKSRDWGF